MHETIDDPALHQCSTAGGSQKARQSYATVDCLRLLAIRRSPIVLHAQSDDGVSVVTSVLRLIVSTRSTATCLLSAHRVWSSGGRLHPTLARACENFEVQKGLKQEHQRSVGTSREGAAGGKPCLRLNHVVPLARLATALTGGRGLRSDVVGIIPVLSWPQGTSRARREHDHLNRTSNV